jgi:hypothetical protein
MSASAAATPVVGPGLVATSCAEQPRGCLADLDDAMIRQTP